MRHRVAGRKLGRTTEHRTALLRNLSTALFDKEKITTTLAKAKELRPFAEKLVTLAKKETLHARRLVLRHVQDKKVVAKLLDTLSARYAQRPGGYTRILKLGPRRGDHAEMAIIELVGAEGDGGAEKKSKASKKGKSKARKGRSAKAAAASAKEAKPAAKSAKKAGKKTAKKKAGRKAKAEEPAQAEEAAKPAPRKKAKTKAKSKTAETKTKTKSKTAKTKKD